MTKSTTKTTKTSAVFLAAVLVAGTFALISPSFMGGAEAYPDYGMDSKKYKSKYPSYGYDNDYKSKYPDKDKDKDKKVIVKKVKCNNINVNINGLEIGDIGSTTDALTAQAAEEAEAANFGNNDNGPDFNIEDNFVFVCINNNNNAGQDDDDEDGVEGCDEFVACFDEFPTQAEVIEDRLAEPGAISIQNVPGLGTYVIGPGVETLEELCEWLFTPRPNGDVVTTEEQLEFILDDLLGGTALPDDLLQCLVDAIGLEPEENGII